MASDRPRGDANDPTLTPSEAVAATNVASETTTLEHATGKLPTRYAVQRPLGIGGMGEVVLAFDRQIGREVAIKRMRVAPSESALTRFTREAKIQARLEHPAIVPVHELATDDEGRPFFVMKRLTGTTLADIIANGTQPRQKLLRAFAEVCLAIELAHSRGVVHRDLKPANIMLGDFGEVYVLDWGVARIDEADDTAAALPIDADTAPGLLATEAGAILGTPGYIAPEQLRGETVDGRADVYSLGCILFEILAGEPLLPRGREALKAALQPVDARPSLRSSSDIAPELDALCVEATRLDHRARPSARELAQRIERYLDGDRDLALRKHLASSHLSAARAALIRGDRAAERSIAMREAGRAIALDPHDRDAAQVVSRLMLEPPREVPPDVERRVLAIEEEAGKHKTVLMSKMFFAFFAMIPAVLLIGVRSSLSLAMLTGAIAVNVGVLTYFARRRTPPSSRSIAISSIFFALLIAMVAREFSPYLLAPSVAAASVTLLIVDARAPWRLITALFTAAIIVPWLLELTGVLSRTMSVIHGDLVLHFEVMAARFPQGEIALAVFVMVNLVTCAISARQLAMQQRNAVRSVELQAWHLRQLVQS